MQKVMHHLLEILMCVQWWRASAPPQDPCPIPGEALGGFCRAMCSRQLHGLCNVRTHRDSGLSSVSSLHSHGYGRNGKEGREVFPHGSKVPRKPRTETTLVLQNLVPVRAEPDHRRNNCVGATFSSSVQAAACKGSPQHFLSLLRCLVHAP